MKLAFAITALTSMVTFVAADLQFSLSSRPSVAAQTSSPAEIPPFVGWSTDRCTITKALDKAEDDGWGEEGGGYWRFTFKDTYNREKFNVAYYPEKDNCTINVHAPLTKYYDVSITNKAPYNIIDPYEADIFTMDCSTV